MLSAAGTVERDAAGTDDRGRRRLPSARPRPCADMKFDLQQVVLVAMTGEARDRDAPVVFHLGVDLHARFEDRHFLHRTHDTDAAPVVAPHEVLVRSTPPRNPFPALGSELIRQPDEFVGEHGPPATNPGLPWLKSQMAMDAPGPMSS